MGNIMSKLRKPIYALTVLAILALPAWYLYAAYGAIAGWWNSGHGMRVMSGEQAKYVGYIAVAFGLITLLISLLPKPRAKFGIILGIFAIAFPLIVENQATKYSVARLETAGIHDVSSDRVNPPIYSETILTQRGTGGRNNPIGDYSTKATRQGTLVADIVEEAYPDIKTITLNEASDSAYDRALSAAKGMGWEIVTTDKAGGIIEATASTRWYKFKDDVVIRISPNGAQSLVDIRSISRTGGRDFGKNAGRIRGFMKKLGS